MFWPECLIIFFSGGGGDSQEFHCAISNSQNICYRQTLNQTSSVSSSAGCQTVFWYRWSGQKPYNIKNSSCWALSPWSPIMPYHSMYSSIWGHKTGTYLWTRHPHGGHGYRQGNKPILYHQFMSKLRVLLSSLNIPTRDTLDTASIVAGHPVPLPRWDN